MSVKQKKQTFTITMPDGSKEEVHEVITFEFNDTKKRYLVYTKNEVDDAGNITVYVTEVIHEGDINRFVGVESDEEWTKIKDVLRELAKKHKNGDNKEA